MHQYKRIPLSIEEQDKLINACQNDEEKLIILGILETGLRVSEFCSLTKNNFRFQEGVILVNGKGGKYGKQGKLRTIPMTAIAKELFSKFFVWNNCIGLSSRTAQRIIKKVADKARIIKPVTPHVLRHTFAVNCLRKGINIVSVQKVLGHDDIHTTMIYLNLQPEDLIKEFKEKW